MSLNSVNKIYKSKQGEALAKEELVPVVKKYSIPHPKILEVGCGYGRNSLAMSEINGAQVTGCDISEVELKKANNKLKRFTKNKPDIEFFLQESENVLPFEDNSFDVVVAWQVLEHVLKKKTKINLLTEMTRVVNDGGIIIIETPNLFFPIDYHDNSLPFLHWFPFLKTLRYKLTRKIRDEDFPPSQYISWYGIVKHLYSSPFVKVVAQLSRIYFERSYIDIFKNLGGTRQRFKVIFFTLYFPIYFVFKAFGLPGDLFVPSLRLVFKVKK